MAAWKFKITVILAQKAMLISFLTVEMGVCEKNRVEKPIHQLTPRRCWNSVPLIMQSFRRYNNMQLDHTNLFGKQTKLDKQFDSSYSIFMISPVSASMDYIPNYFPYIVQCYQSTNCKVTSFILVSTSISSWSVLQDWLKNIPKTYC